MSVKLSGSPDADDQKPSNVHVKLEEDSMFVQQESNVPVTLELDSMADEENKGSSEQKDKCGTTVFVTSLPPLMTQDEFRSLFSTTGEVMNCTLIKHKPTGCNLYGFVSYQRPEDAKRTINTLNGLLLLNKIIKVFEARSKTNLFVTGFPKDMTQQEFESFFRPYGRIISSKILYDKVSSPDFRGALEHLNNLPTRSKGVGFVRFDQRMDAEKAVLELHGTIPKGFAQRINVKHAYTSSEKIAASQTVDRFISSFCTRTARQFRYCPWSPWSRDFSPNLTVSGSSVNDSGWCILVRNLPPATEDIGLWQLFRQFGAIQKVNVVRCPKTTYCKGYAFVTMNNFREAELAIRFNHERLYGGCLLQVSFKN